MSSDDITACKAGSATVANFPLGPMQHPKTNTPELWHTVRDWLCLRVLGLDARARS